MVDLPPIIAPDPDTEATELGLTERVFAPLDRDADVQKDAETPEPPLRAYLLLDASASPDIAVCLEAFSNPCRCLFDGEAFEDLAEVAPWLVELTRHSDVWDWYLEDGFGHNWGILIHSRLTIARLKTHLKKFVRVEDEDGERYFFKYYRPEHLNAFLPVFEPDQVTRFFYDISAYHSEDRDSEGHLLSWICNADGVLERSRANLRTEGQDLMVKPADPADAAKLIEALSVPD